MHQLIGLVIAVLSALFLIIGFARCFAVFGLDAEESWILFNTPAPLGWIALLCLAAGVVLASLSDD